MRDLTNSDPWSKSTHRGIWSLKQIRKMRSGQPQVPQSQDHPSGICRPNYPLNQTWQWTIWTIPHGNGCWEFPIAIATLLGTRLRVPRWSKPLNRFTGLKHFRIHCCMIFRNSWPKKDQTKSIHVIFSDPKIQIQLQRTKNHWFWWWISGDLPPTPEVQRPHLWHQRSHVPQRCPSGGTLSRSDSDAWEIPSGWKLWIYDFP